MATQLKGMRGFLCRAALDQGKYAVLGGDMAEDGINSFMTGPDEQGRFGMFGGRFCVGNADAADP
jgi:hypothetical protein